MKLTLLIRTLALATLTLSATNALALNFSDARQLTHTNADLLKVYGAQTAAREQTTESLRSLHGPQVTMDVKQVWGRKKADLGTKTVPLGAFIPGAPDINLPLQFTDDLSGPRATANVTLPIFMGGQITAKIAASEASVYESRAEEASKRDELDTELAKRYFGVQLAASVKELREAMLKHEEEELKKASRFFKAGTISHLERTAFEVNRDKSKRELIAATADLTIAESELKSLMRVETLDHLTTPLFVIEDDAMLGTLSEWINKARNYSPILRMYDAKRSMAQAGLSAAKGAWSPQIYAFGTANLIKHYLAITEPDWIAGIGVKFTLWDNRDRNAAIGAARSTVAQAEAARSEAREQLTTGVKTAYWRVHQMRDEYKDTKSTLALAKENLRLREKAFSEGLSSASDVTVARNTLLAAELALRVASYRFVVSWATLNALSGNFDGFLTTMDTKNKYTRRN